MTRKEIEEMLPEFQARIKVATTSEEMLAASMKFISFHGGFSGSPEARAKFKEQTIKG